jgi:hypothetical protein
VLVTSGAAGSASGSRAPGEEQPVVSISKPERKNGTRFIGPLFGFGIKTSLRVSTIDKFSGISTDFD